MEYVLDSELVRQRAFANDIRSRFGGGKSYYIATLGCQMNVRDSETIAGMLTEMGFEEASCKEEADIVLYNTCCVRENAENKALGNVIWLKELKRDKPDMIIGACGCMMQEKGVAQSVGKQYPFIDLVFGTHNAHKLPEYMHRILFGRERVIEVSDSDGVIAEGLPAKRQRAHAAFINIMFGCDNFCSYCIVPYVRGRERSRRAEDIVSEARALKLAGVKEITLLGQNVNSYQSGDFAGLLYKIAEVGIERVRFMTSHPKDLSDDLIRAMRDIDCVMPQLHLPVQAGSDEILSRMNRRYTREKYLDVVRRLRNEVPGIGLTTDIIVGFPGETLSQFEETLSLVREVRYDSAYTFIYSPRVGTRAAQMPDDTPADVKSERLSRLIELQQQISAEILEERIGDIETVLVEDASQREEGFICGRTPRGHMVNFPGNENMIGRFAKVRITSAGRNTLKGEIING